MRVGDSSRLARERLAWDRVRPPWRRGNPGTAPLRAAPAAPRTSRATHLATHRGVRSPPTGATPAVKCGLVQFPRPASASRPATRAPFLRPVGPSPVFLASADAFAYVSRAIRVSAPDWYRCRGWDCVRPPWIAGMLPSDIRESMRLLPRRYRASQG